MKIRAYGLKKQDRISFNGDAMLVTGYTDTHVRCTTMNKDQTECLIPKTMIVTLNGSAFPSRDEEIKRAINISEIE